MTVRIIRNDLPRLIRETPGKVDTALNILAENGVTIVKTSMLDSPAGGNTYRRGSKTHTSAVAGNPPRPDTGTLINSIMSEQVRTMVYRIFTQVEYGIYLEFGSTRWAGGITFPFMGPMAVKVEALVPQVFDGLVE